MFYTITIEILENIGYLYKTLSSYTYVDDPVDTYVVYFVLRVTIHVARR